MLFNSLEFMFFLPIVFVAYWFFLKKTLRIQNLLIVVASYYFYGLWDWRFLTLIFFSTIVDYSIGYSFDYIKTATKRKVLLWLSILVNLGFLGFFKYFNFFIESFKETYSFLGGNPVGYNTLQIILPVGISFYTFQTLSYTIDVYKGKLQPTKDFVAFAAFVSFFPQLVAGPIERATNLLPQFTRKRTFDYEKAVDGVKQILWGFFKKIIIADKCAIYANIIFNNSEEYSGSTLLLGAIFFSFQIYGDFSGYSDIAIGVSKLFGFDLKKNFATPYFSRDIAEFWRRWHISLSTWFRDYLYIPLGGSRGGLYSKIRNVFIIFIVSGFWHGANWTFVVWGGVNALYFIPIMLLNYNRSNTDVVAQNKLFPSIKEILQVGLTFFLTTIAWIFFRSETISQSLIILKKIFSTSLFVKPIYDKDGDLKLMLFLLIFFIAFEWMGRKKEHVLQFLEDSYPKVIKYLIFYILVFMILLLKGKSQEFIYFQF